MSKKSARGKSKSNSIWIGVVILFIIIATLIWWPKGTTGKNFPEVVKYYPELQESLVVSHGIIQTESTTTAWFNFAPDATVNPFALKEYFRYFEQMARGGIQLNYAIDGQPTFLSMQPSRQTNRVFFFIANNDPKPAWSNSDAQGSTFYDNAFNATFIRVIHKDTLPKSSLFTTPKMFLTKMVAVEACQTFLSTLTDSSNSDRIVIAQEVTCNSFGDAFASKQLGITSDVFLEWMQRITYFGGQIPIALDESSYQAIPYVGEAITIK